MTTTFLAAATDRALSLGQYSVSRCLASWVSAAAQSSPDSVSSAATVAAACDAAAAALADGDAEFALAAADHALTIRPDWPLAWIHRATALNDLQLHADMLAAVPYMESVGAPWQTEGMRARAALEGLYEQLPMFMDRTKSDCYASALTAWKELYAADPTSLQARSAVYGEWLQQATRIQELERSHEATSGGNAEGEEASGISCDEITSRSIECLRETATDAAAYRASENVNPAVMSCGDISHFLKVRRPNVPLAAYGQGGADRAEGETGDVASPVPHQCSISAPPVSTTFQYYPLASTSTH